MAKTNAKYRVRARKAGKAMAKDLQALQALNNPTNDQIDEMFELTLVIKIIETWNDPKNRRDYTFDENTFADWRYAMDELGNTCVKVANTFGYDLKKRIHDKGIWMSQVDVEPFCKECYTDCNNPTHPKEHKTYEAYLDQWLFYAAETSITEISKKYIPELNESRSVELFPDYLGYIFYEVEQETSRIHDTVVYSKTFVVQR